MGHLLGVKSEDLKKSLLKPRIKVGNEWVYQGRSADQVILFLVTSPLQKAIEIPIHFLWHFSISILYRVSYRIFGLGGGGEIYWCINEARKCEGVGDIFSNSWGGGN